MPIRGPRKMDVFHDDKFFYRFCSVRNGVKFFAGHWGVRYGTAKDRINRSCRENNGYFQNFRFVKDPDYVTSRLVVAINHISGEYLVFSSVNKAAEYIFGKRDMCGTRKISDLCRSGRIHHATGLAFMYLKNGYVFSPPSHTSHINRPILQLHKYTGAVIKYFYSVNEAATHIFNLGVSKASKVNIATNISGAANGKDPNIRAPHGFKWRYVRHDEPPENIPLPEPDHEGS